MGINLPNGANVEEIILPNGSQASEVIGPDGSTLWERNAIPDSIELQYEATEVSGGDTVWTDLNSVEDMSLTGNETDTTLSDGSEALEFDTDAGDHGTYKMPASLENSGQQTFSVEFALQYTESSRAFLTACRPAGDNRTMRFEANATENGEESGNMRFIFVDDSENAFAFEFENNPNLNDGNRHDITYIFHDISQHDVTVIVDGTERNINITKSDNPNDFFDYGDEDWVFAGFNDEGTIREQLSMDAGAMYWYTDAIDQQYISNY